MNDECGSSLIPLIYLGIQNSLQYFTVVIAKQQLLSGQLPNTQSNLYWIFRYKILFLYIVFIVNTFPPYSFHIKYWWYWFLLQDASQADIRRAYRKLSLQLHPDKNKEPDADVKFRQVK